MGKQAPRQRPLYNLFIHGQEVFLSARCVGANFRLSSHRSSTCDVERWRSESFVVQNVGWRGQHKQGLASMPYRYRAAVCETKMALKHVYIQMRTREGSTDRDSLAYRNRYCAAAYETTLYLQKVALTSPTSGGRSVGIVRSRTKRSWLVYETKVTLK
jgi:hypothetical protein